jgi:hypothetical protein
MTTYVFDVHGTLVDNPFVTDEDIRKMLLVLRSRGHHLIAWSSELSSVDQSRFEGMIDEFWPKWGRSLLDVGPGCVVFDDDSLFLRSISRRGAKVVAASQMGEWIENEDWSDVRGNESGRQDPAA